VEARGRLFVEPGKGRKAIILSGRARRMPSLEWRTVAMGGGLEGSNEFWASICAQGTLLMVGSAVREVLGWGANDMVGNTLHAFVISDGSARLEQEIGRMAMGVNAKDPRQIWVDMVRKDGTQVGIVIVLYRPMDGSATPAILICQIKLAHSSSAYEPPVLGRLAHAAMANVFEELETSRDSSWQYELQQLKFSNQRLQEEVTALENNGGTASAPPFTASSLHLPRATAPGSQEEWGPSTLTFHGRTRPLKRSWDQVNICGS